MTAIIATDTEGNSTHANDLAAPVGSTSVAENVVFDREGRPRRRNGFKKYSTGMPPFNPTQLIASAAGDQAYVHADGALWYDNGGTWTRKSGGTMIATMTGIWVDATESNAYFTAAASHAIYKLNLASSTLTVVAGLPGTSGTANGTGTVARFNTPVGIWGDGTNLYVCDRSNFAIRKIVISSGVVTTFAGLIGTAAHTDHATGTSARFQSPHGIWSDGTNLYVTEVADGYARKITIGGSQTVTTLTSGLSFPTGAWIASGGSTLYVVTELGATKLKSIPVSTGIASDFATGLIGTSGYALIHADSTYIWVPGTGGLSRVTRSNGAVNNSVFSSSSADGVWVFSGKLWITPLAAAYPSTGAVVNLYTVSGYGTNTSCRLFASISGPD